MAWSYKVTFQSFRVRYKAELERFISSVVYSKFFQHINHSPKLVSTNASWFSEFTWMRGQKILFTLYSKQGHLNFWRLK